jgi:hypothetical protein
MSTKKNKKPPAAVESTEDTLSLDELEKAAEVDAGDLTDEEDDTPKLSREEAKALFQTYRDVNAEIIAAEQNILSLTAQRSNVVKAIHDGVGKGPFKFDGATVTVMSRTAKEEGSETSYFFKRLGAAIVDMDS